MIKLYCVLIAITFVFTSFAQKIQSIGPSSNVRGSAMLKNGSLIISTRDSKLYMIKQNITVLLSSSPGSGKYFSMSKDEQNVGFKYIDSNGNQIPSVINPATKEIKYLHQPVKEAGQVSFADNGTIAFTIGNNLIVKSSNSEKNFTLGNYSNLTPISPDAKYVAYNDNYDQIYTLNLITGEKQKITDDSSGYFDPKWSPDGTKLLYSSLAGSLKVYNLTNAETFSLGEGFSACWSSNSLWVVFYRKVIRELELLNSDIYLSNFDGKGLHRLTSTPDQLEIDPSFTTNDSGIVYSLSNSSTIVETKFSPTNFTLSNQVKTNVDIPINNAPIINSYEQTQDVDTLNIPYINQLYDTPDYFNGSAACGPTTAMMVLAYYNILPAWNINCSWPYEHKSPWGQYISDTYRFRQMSYVFTAKDPNGRGAQGAYGYMWTGSSHPYSTMASFFYNHGIGSSRSDTPSYQYVKNEVDNGRPYVLCIGLTSAGHIIVAHGTAEQPYTFIFNDPYGNKNLGYPNYSGKNVKYDWPGYNNGYQNLQYVYWGVSIKYTPKIVSDTLIDDLDFGKGFYLNNQAPASMSTWKDLNQGYDGHMWFTFTTSSSTTDTCYATWTPNLPEAGYYEVSAYIPYSQAEDVKYKIHTLDGVDTVSINQKSYTDSWASLGRYNFDKGSSGYVRLGDASSIKGEAVIFDAMKWTYVSSVTGIASEKNDTSPINYQLSQNYPNPFNPTTVIKYSVLNSQFVTIKVFDIIGRMVALLVNEQKSKGTYSVNFNATNLAAGIYFYQLRAGNFVQTKKMILIK